MLSNPNSRRDLQPLAYTAPMRRPLLLLFALVVWSTAAFAAERLNCKNRKGIVGECFTMHGRLSVRCGDQNYWLWQIGTKHKFDVGFQDAFPASVHQEWLACGSVGAPSWIFGHFVVCPLEKEKAGEAQAACIVSAQITAMKPSSWNAKSPEKR